MSIKRLMPFILFLLIMSAVSGYLLSKASWMGRVGISLLYTQYSFLKVWWQGALAVFIALLVLLITQAAVKSRAGKATSTIIQIAALLVALFGLYLTYHDFRHYLSHRWLGERFHIGAYLFWIDWIIISLFVLLTDEQKKVVINSNNKAPINE